MTLSQSRKIAYYCGSFFILFAIGWSFYIIGSPSYRNALLADHNQINMVYSLKSAINEYSKLEKKLPPTLQTLIQAGEKIQTQPVTSDKKEYNFYTAYGKYRNDKQYFTNPAAYNDNNTQLVMHDIDYDKKDDTHYQLCTTFNYDYNLQKSLRYSFDWENTLTESEKKSGLLSYKQGENCFIFSIEN